MKCLHIIIQRTFFINGGITVDSENIAIVAIFTVGSLAAWYWASQTLTYSLTVEVQISATTNFDWTGDLTDDPTYATLVTRCVDEIFEQGGMYYIRVASGGFGPKRSAVLPDRCLLDGECREDGEKGNRNGGGY